MALSLLFGRLFAVRMRELFANPRRLARTIAEVVKLRAAHVALSLDLDARNEGRIGLKGSFDPFATRNLAHDKRGIEPTISLGDDDTLVGLHPFALAFDHAHVD